MYYVVCFILKNICILTIWELTFFLWGKLKKKKNLTIEKIYTEKKINQIFERKKTVCVINFDTSHFFRGSFLKLNFNQHLLKMVGI